MAYSESQGKESLSGYGDTIHSVLEIFEMSKYCSLSRLSITS